MKYGEDIYREKRVTVLLQVKNGQYLPQRAKIKSIVAKTRRAQKGIKCIIRKVFRGPKLNLEQGKAGKRRKRQSASNNRAALVRELMWIHYPSVCGRSSAERICPNLFHGPSLGWITSATSPRNQFALLSDCERVHCSRGLRVGGWEVGGGSFKRPFLSSAAGVYFAAGYFSF
jgi:hypothetical protein